MTFKILKPTIDCLSDEVVLVQAWRKTAAYIRYHNWFSDTLELDKTAVNLREFIADIAAEIRSGQPLRAQPIRMVPAPKSQPWRVDKAGRWGPVDGKASQAKIRPLAHVSLRDQVIATALMMCLADRVESRQGNPSTDLEKQDLHRSVVSYGNRLFSDYDQAGRATYRWGTATYYRGYFDDYRQFLMRPEIVAEKIGVESRESLIVQSDLRQFYDRVTADLLHGGIRALQSETDDPAFFQRATDFLSWTWDKADKADVQLYVQQSGIDDFSKVVLPQGLAAAGFFANVALGAFDEHLRDAIGKEIITDVTLCDASRYVDDLRLVLSAPPAADIESIREGALDWLKQALDRSAAGLSPEESKTLVSAFRADQRPLVQQSRRMARIQAAISGGFDPIAGGEILDSVLSLVRAQERLSTAEMIDGHDPFRPVPDVRNATIDRFVANRFRTTFRSLRPMLWETAEQQREAGENDDQSRFKVARTQSELDEETRVFALELMSKWVADPSNVRLVRVALDLWPDVDVLRRVLGLLEPFTAKGGPKKTPRRIALYCLSEILRAGAVETGFVEDDEQLPSGVNLVGYRSLLREVALQIVRSEQRLPWYLRQQAYLLLATEPSQTPDLISPSQPILRPYGKLLRFLKGGAGTWSVAEFSTYAVLARSAFVDAETAVALTTPHLTRERLNAIARLDPNFATEIVVATGQRSWFTPRVKADLGLVDKDPANTRPLASLVLSLDTREMLRNERALLSFATKFLGAVRTQKPVSAITPSEVFVTMDENDRELTQLQLQLRDLGPDSLYDPPAWVPEADHWRFQLGFLLRFILTAQPDFTRAVRPAHWKEREQIYRAPRGHWHERIYGFFNGHVAFGDDWLPITEWMERLLFGLLWWPGCASRRDELVGLLDDTLGNIEARLTLLQSLQGSSAALLPLRTPGLFHRDGKPLRACVIQMAFPCEEDFNEDDLTMSSPMLRRRHRRHLSAALAAVRSALALRETHKGMDGRLDWLILPELAVHPDDVRTHLIPFARAYKTVILTGLTYQELFAGQPLVNSALWVIPTYDDTRGVQILVRRQGKKHLAPSEHNYLTNGLVQSFRPCQWLIGYEWSSNTNAEPLWLTASICFDATDLRLAADLKNQSDVFAITAMNKDVNTFDNMAMALHYHMHQMVIVANNGNYGGSNSYAPYKNALGRRIFHLHGQPQASIAFLELEDIAGFKERGSDTEKFKPRPAGSEL